MPYLSCAGWQLTTGGWGRRFFKRDLARRGLVGMSIAEGFGLLAVFMIRMGKRGKVVRAPFMGKVAVSTTPRAPRTSCFRVTMLNVSAP